MIFIEVEAILLPMESSERAIELFDSENEYDCSNKQEIASHRDIRQCRWDSIKNHD